MVLASMYFRLYWKALALCYWGTTSRLTVFENQSKSLVFAHFLQIEKSIVHTVVHRQDLGNFWRENSNIQRLFLGDFQIA